MFVSCVHRMAVLHAAFFMTCPLLMLVEVRPRTCGCVAMGSAVLFILRSRLLLYSAGHRVNNYMLCGLCVL